MVNGINRGGRPMIIESREGIEPTERGCNLCGEPFEGEQQGVKLVLEDPQRNRTTVELHKGCVQKFEEEILEEDGEEDVG